MKKGLLYIILVLYCLLSDNAYSQIDCTVPLPPDFTNISVQPETGKTEFNWTLSQSSDIAAYIIYSYKDGIGMPIDTIWNPTATSYTLTGTSTKYFSVSYVIASHRISGTPGRPGCTSPLSNALTTIFAESDIDTCNKKIVVSWNSYTPVPKNVNGYSILVSVNGGPFTETVNLPSDKKSYTLNDFTTDVEYCFVVRANLEGGTISTSNKTCLLTKMQRAPRWINADYATINEDNKIALSFTVDPLSELTRFRLERRSGQTGTFQEIAQPGYINGSVIFTDNQADIKNVNYYRLSAINNCNNPVTVSNLSSNIVLSLDRIDNDLVLSWNSYKKWAGIISSYNIFINTGNGYEVKEILQPADTIFKLGYKRIMYEISGNEVCFYITAVETSNPFGINSLSSSTKVCSVPTEIITVPNVFTPNNDMLNDYFRPVLSFTPLDYHLIISDRQGKILFETRDSQVSWDGNQNGIHQPDGVCLWFLKIITPSGKSISKTGTLTIINSK
jgi:gliding motility-associated-like protein